MVNATRIRPVSTETPPETGTTTGTAIGDTPRSRPEAVTGFVLAMAGMVAVLMLTQVLPGGGLVWAARAVGAVAAVVLAAGVPGRVTARRAAGAVLGAVVSIGIPLAIVVLAVSQME